MRYCGMAGQSLILPKKEKYTVEDARQLIKAGHKPMAARLIVCLSALYHFGGEPGHVSESLRDDSGNQ